MTSLLVAALGLAVGMSNLRIAAAAERLVVFRLGRFDRVAGPGIVFLLPFLDRGVRVDLDRTVPEWRSLGAAALAARLDEVVRRPRSPQ